MQLIDFILNKLTDLWSVKPVRHWSRKMFVGFTDAQVVVLNILAIAVFKQPAMKYSIKKENLRKRKWLFGGTVPPAKNLFGGTVGTVKIED